MKEIPILYSPPMVQAVMNDRKTKTRRKTGLDKINENPDDWEIISLSSKNQYNQLIATFKNRKLNKVENIKSPYGKPGDLLWVREKHRSLFNCQTEAFERYDYYADMPEDFHVQMKKKYPKRNWKPSIHMPKAAARIWLRVTDIRIERLQDISEEDAISEGIKSRYSEIFNEERYHDYLNEESEWRFPESSFQSLWTKINGPESWDLNPWVWVVSFEVMSKTGKPVHEAPQEPFMRSVCPKCEGKGWYFVNERIGNLQGRKDCRCKGNEA